jgi:transcriptional regulator with XRE-family HTH domain
MNKEVVPGLDERIAARVRELRAAHELSLQALAIRSGVSRSLISLIERAECSPTAVVLEKLATALGVVLASLFDARPERSRNEPVSRRAAQSEWQDPASGYVRRNLSPAWMPQPMRLVEVEFPAGARVAFECAPQERCVYQQVWVLDGAIQVTVGSNSHELRKGDCMANVLDRPIMFYNPTHKTTRYLVVLTAELPKNGAAYASKATQAVRFNRKARSIANGAELKVGV